MEQFDKTTFFNNALWHEWFTDQSLTNEKKKSCRALMDECVVEAMWRTSLRVWFRRIFILRYVDEQNIIEDHGDHVSVFLDFHGLSFPMGKPPILRYAMINVHQSHPDKTFVVPVREILTYYSAGWPRHGYHPNMYVIKPWTMLEPIRDYLQRDISLQTLKDMSLIFFVNASKPMRYLQEEIKKTVEEQAHYHTMCEPDFRNRLKTLHDEMIDMAKKQLHEAFEHINPYGGLNAWMDVSFAEDDKNPLIEEYITLKNDYDSKKAVKA